MRAIYQAEVRHGGLNKYRVIKGSDKYVVEQKARAQLRAWEEMWEKKQQAVVAQQQRELSKQTAIDRTSEAVQVLTDLKNTLRHTLSVNDAIDWEKLKDHTSFKMAKPTLRNIGEPPVSGVPREPKKYDDIYKPRGGLMASLFSSVKKSRAEEAEKLLEADHKKWQAEVERASASHLRRMREYEESRAYAQHEYEAGLKVYESKMQKWQETRKQRNSAIDKKRQDYLAQQPGAVIDYCEMVLSASKYPDPFPQEFDIEYVPVTKTLLVDYSLPNPEQIPSLKEVKYVQSKDSFQEVYLTEKERDALYDSLIYQITLRTLHELFEADTGEAIERISFNGLVTAIDKATGREKTGCIVSICTTKDEFTGINLADVDSKKCFKALKGVGSSKLHSLTPVPPIMQMDKQDKRFVEGYGVADGMDESTNLAAMDWEDFEHLVRELFEKEFKEGGGEVKVTQASRDGGVDAIAFDPDPIRGGKIVIQAKRYSNVVSVSAVRDLYGTVVNEGAIKGVLVTTADYGPDSYEFARGKPLTLLNGSNLLHLLEKHGHKCRIDLVEARSNRVEHK